MSRDSELRSRAKLLSPKLFIVYLLFFILSDATCWPAGINLGAYDLAFFKHCATDSSFILFMSVKYFILITIYFLNMQRILQYDSSDETGKTLKKAELGIKTIEKHILWWQGVSVLLVIPAMLYAAKYTQNENVRPIAMFFEVIGSTGIVAVFIYVPFLAMFEKWVDGIIPFNADNKIHRTNTSRGLLVVIINSYGQLFVAIAGFFCFSVSSESAQVFITHRIGTNNYSKPTSTACSQSTIVLSGDYFGAGNSTFAIEDTSGNPIFVYTIPEVFGSSANSNYIMLLSSPLIKTGISYNAIKNISAANGTIFHNLYITLPSVTGGSTTLSNITTNTSNYVYTKTSSSNGGATEGSHPNPGIRW